MRETRLPDVPELDTVRRRLEAIFPKGVENRGHLVRELACRTVFAMLYVDAVEGHGWVRPNQVARMTDAEVERRGDAERRAWAKESLRPGAGDIPGRWYAGNTREPIRDETLRYGLKRVGAVVERPGLKTTSALPRWALAADFAALFLCPEDEFDERAEAWRRRHLTAGALTRLAAVQAGIAGGREGHVLVTLPSGGTRSLAPGDSSVIARAVIEQFAPRFLAQPGVVWLSESSRRDEAADIELAKVVRIDLSESRILPDLILVELAGEDTRFVFVEVVATDGPMNDQRRADLSVLLERGGHSAASAVFVTAFLDREQAAFRRLSSQIAWDSFVWFAAEPDKLVHFRDLQHEAKGLFDL